MQKSAVQLRDKNAKVVVPRVSIEDVRNRKNALAAKGMNVAAINTGSTDAPRKIK